MADTCTHTEHREHPLMGTRVGLVERRASGGGTWEHCPEPLLRTGDALCSLAGCGLPLHLEVTATFAIDDSPQPGDLRAAGDWWEVVCENGHKIANGGPDTDSRSARIGWRVGQILGGVR